jgi:hypothetical protein
MSRGPFFLERKCSWLTHRDYGPLFSFPAKTSGPKRSSLPHQNNAMCILAGFDLATLKLQSPRWQALDHAARARISNCLEGFLGPAALHTHTAWVWLLWLLCGYRLCYSGSKPISQQILKAFKRRPWHKKKSIRAELRVIWAFHKVNWR